MGITQRTVVAHETAFHTLTTFAATLSGSEIVGAPATGTSLHITDLVFNANQALEITIPGIIGPVYFDTQGSASFLFTQPLRHGNAATLTCNTSRGSGNLTISGYIE